MSFGSEPDEALLHFSSRQDLGVAGLPTNPAFLEHVSFDAARLALVRSKCFANDDSNCPSEFSE